MQVGFSPISFNQQRNKAQSTNFGCKIHVKSSASQPMGFVEMINAGAHENSKENRSLLKQVIDKIKERSSAKWDVPEIKEAIYKAWGKDDELKEVFKGY